MKDKKIKDQKFYIVPYMDNNLYISRQGTCFDNNTNEILKPIINRKDKYIRYNGEIYLLAELIARTFIGRHNGPIKFIDKDHKNCTSKNITYKYQLNYLTSEKCIIDDEEFRPIPYTNERYFINRYGTVYDKYYGFLRNTIRKGYYKVYLNTDTFITNEVNRLVYMTYIGPIPDDYVVDHKDGNPWHNEPDNLEPVTISENIRRGYESEDYGRSRTWTKEQVHEICKMMEKGYDIYQISDELGIPNGKRMSLIDLLSNLRIGRYHTDITSQYDISNYVINRERIDSRTSDYAQIKQVVKMIRDGFSDTMISREIGIPRIKVYQIKSGKVYKSFVKRAIEELDNE